MDALAAVRVPVLQLAGSASPASFRAGRRGPRRAARRRPARDHRRRPPRRPPQPPGRGCCPRRGVRHRLAPGRTRAAPRSVRSGYHRPHERAGRGTRRHPSVLPGPRGRHRRRDRPLVHRRRGAGACCTAATRSASSSGTAPTRASRSCCGPASGTRSRSSPAAPVPDAVLTALRALPKTAKPMDALRTAVSAWGAVHDPSWPPTPDEARALTAISPSALAAFARLRQGLEPVAPDPDLDLVAGLPVPGQRHARPTPRPPGRSTRTSSSARSTGSTPRPSPAASSRRPAPTSRRRSCGAIGAMKGPLHGGAPSEVVEQIHEVGSPERAEAWVRDDARRAATG